MSNEERKAKLEGWAQDAQGSGDARRAESDAMKAAGDHIGSFIASGQAGRSENRAAELREEAEKLREGEQ